MSISTQVSELQEHKWPNNTFHSCCIHIHIHQPQMISKHVIHENSTYDIHNLDILHHWFLQCSASSRIQHLKGKNSLSFVIFLRFALCSRNFQNVKLRLDFVEGWSFYCHSDFTWNLILVNSNVTNMSFLAILEVLNFDFIKFEQLSSAKFTKNSKFRV